MVLKRRAWMVASLGEFNLKLSGFMQVVKRENK